MCTLAVYTGAWDDLPLLVAANRDEFYERPTVEPEPLGNGDAFGGRDLRAGGSWLAVGRSGLVIGVLNRRAEEPPDPTCSSRGSLCVSLAEQSSLTDALALLREQRPEEYNAFNLLLADRRQAWVAQNRGGRIAVQALDPGLHLLTNLDLNDIECERISRSTHRFAELVPAYAKSRDRARLGRDLRVILSDHLMPLDDRKPTDQLCIHTEVYGTRSSSLVFVDQAGETSFLHAAGPPCRTTYAPMTLPWPVSAPTS